ncbi:MAG: NADH-quinone oxidoreductase subunit H [Desulfobacterales bacterium]|nr:NADH-quinone oxidoreductase subunit H [Desulfobacterales bacterium]
MQSFIILLIFWIISPFFMGVILKVKAFFAGKQGPPVLIHYYTLMKLFQKASVYSLTTTFVFRLSPLMILLTSLSAMLFLPIAGYPAVFSFEGDMILICYLFGLGRFFTIIAALDTGSPFEGMGAAREAYFSVLSEASLFMIFIYFYRLHGSISLNSYLSSYHTIELWKYGQSTLLFIIASLYIVLLIENTRVPVDDPATHLELTMIHEVMILDHSGPDLAFIELGACTKLLFFTCILSRLLFPYNLNYAGLNVICFGSMLILIYVVIGITESIMARFKMTKTPKFILTSFALAFFATFLNWG